MSETSGTPLTPANTPMVVMYPTDAGVVLSQRKANTNSALTVDTNPPRAAKLLDSSYSHDTGTSMAFSVPSSDKASEDLVWAFSKTQPRGDELSGHLWSGSGVINYDRDFETVPNPAPVNSKTAQKNGMPSSVLLAHVVLGVIVTMFLLPSGVVTRVIPSRALHVVLGGFSLLFLLIALGTGASFGSTPSPHRGLGIALFVFFFVQSLLGVGGHFVHLPERFKKGGKLAYAGIGVLCVALGFGSCWTGFVTQWPATGHGYSSSGLKAGWGVMLAFWIVVYAAALWFFLPRHRRQEAEERALEEQGEKRYFATAGSDAPVTPRPPEPKTKGFSPPPSPSMIPISGQWFRASAGSLESPTRSTLDKHEPRRHSDLHTSGMPTSSTVPHVSSRERLDSVITYEGSLSRQQSEESMQSRFARRSSRGSRGSLGSMEESLAQGLDSLKNSVTSLKSLRSRRGSDAPPTAFPFRRGSDSQLYGAQVQQQQDPFKSPVTPTFRASVTASPAPSAFKRGDEDALSFRTRRRRRDSNASGRSARSLDEFSYRERKTSDASFLAIERSEPEPESLKLVDRRDSDPFGLDKALSALNFGGLGGGLSFSSDNLSLFRDKTETVVNAITGVRERKPSHGRRWSDQSGKSGRSSWSASRPSRPGSRPGSRAGSVAPRSRSGSMAEAAPSSFAPRSRNNSFTDRKSTDGRRSIDAAPSAFATMSRSGSLAQKITPKTTPTTATPRPPSRGSSTPPVSLSKATAARARPAPRPSAQAVVSIPAEPITPKFEPRPDPPVPSSVSRPSSQTPSAAPRHSFGPPPPQRSSDLRLRRLSNSHRAIPVLEVRTDRPSSSTASSFGTSAVAVGQGRGKGDREGKSKGPIAPLTSATKRSHISSVTPIASRFRANTVSTSESFVSDESVPPPVPPKD